MQDKIVQLVSGLSESLYEIIYYRL